MRKNAGWLLAWLVVLGLALGMRAINVDFGLPQRLHPDEWSQVEVAWQMANGDWNPHFFRYPAGQMTMLAFMYRLVSAFRPLELPELYLFARWVNVIFGTLGVCLAGWWAWRIWRNHWVAVSTGLLAAFSWTWIEQSHYAIVDVPLLFWSGLVLYGLYESGREKRWLIVSAIALGFAIATKYTAILLVLPFLFMVWLESDQIPSFSTSARRKIIGALMICGLAGLGLFAFSFVWKGEILSRVSSLTGDGHLEREYLQLYGQLAALLGLAALSFFSAAIALERWPNWRGWQVLFDRKIYGLLFVAFLIFFLLSPFTLLEWRQSARDLFYEYRHMQIGSAAHYSEDSPLAVSVKSLSFLPSLTAYLSLFLNEWGAPALIFVCLGSLSLLRFHQGFGIALLVYLAFQFLMIAGWQNYAFRYALPLYLPMAVLAGGGLWALYRWLQKNQASWAVAVTALVIVAVLWIPVRSMLAGLSFFRLPDTRQAAYAWALDNIPNGATVAYDSYAPDFEAGPHTSQFLRTSNYVLYEYPPVKLQEAGVEFVFTTYDPKSDPASLFVPVEDWIEFTNNYQLVKAFLSQPELLRGRSIWVYEAIPVQ